MKKIKLLCFAFLFVNAVAQPEKEVYKFSTDIENTIENDTVPWKYQIGANEYSFIGNYKKARETWDKNGVGIPEITAEDSLYFNEFSPVNAKEYIIERSKNEQIIIINEAHTNPKHRTFTHSLLQGLYDNGYRYLGLEALWDMHDTLDIFINERKYSIMKSGYYTKEPEFGNFIYAALKIGFTLFGYDGGFEYGGKEREIAQARNIVNFMEKNPPAKVLLHCGHDHVIEGAHRTWEKAMAGRVKEYTQIDPFTIDQTQYAEKSDKKYNHPYISMVNKAFPVILIDKDGNLFNGEKGSDQVDCKIIYPETHCINGRPNWLFSEGNRKVYYIEKSKIVQYPLLVLAYRKGEFDNNGVPTDVIEIIGNENIPPLILGKGDYEIIMKDSHYNIVDRYAIIME